MENIEPKSLKPGGNFIIQEPPPIKISHDYLLYRSDKWTSSAILNPDSQRQTDAHFIIIYTLLIQGARRPMA